MLYRCELFFELIFIFKRKILRICVVPLSIDHFFLAVAPLLRLRLLRSCLSLSVSISCFNLRLKELSCWFSSYTLVPYRFPHDIWILIVSLRDGMKLRLINHFRGIYNWVILNHNCTIMWSWIAECLLYFSCWCFNVVFCLFSGILRSGFGRYSDIVSYRCKIVAWRFSFLLFKFFILILNIYWLLFYKTLFQGLSDQFLRALD